MERQFDLFGEKRPSTRPPRGKGTGTRRIRRHRPTPGELGIALAEAQVEVTHWVLERLAVDDGLRGHAIPILVGDVLHLPRDLEVVSALMDGLDERLLAAAAEHLETSPERERLLSWRRPADRLAQEVHEWWLAGG